MFNRTFKNYSLALALLATSPLSHAQISGSGELGYSNNTGNTENSSLYASLELNYEKDQFLFESDFETSFKEEDKEQTEERYVIDLQANYYLNTDKTFFSFAGAKFEKNEFQDIELDTTLSAGIGKNLYKTESTSLTGEIGLGQQNTDYVSSGTDSETQTVTVGKLAFTHQINEHVEFLQDIKVSSGSERTQYETNTAFKVKVAEKANLKISYKNRHNDKPASNTKKTDTQTLVTLTYDL